MTTILIAAAGVVVVFVVLAYARKKFAAAQAKARIADIPGVFEKLRASAKDGNFAVFLFTPDGATAPETAFNVQFSIEGGRIGFDWVLLAKPNIREKDRFVQLARKLGHKVVEREMNQVMYLRVEEGDLPGLCEATIHHLYSGSAKTELDLIVEGFTWP